MPGKTGRTYGVPGANKLYLGGMRTNPRWPLAPPPKVECTVCALAFSSLVNTFSVSFLGSPLMGVNFRMLEM